MLQVKVRGPLYIYTCHQYSNIYIYIYIFIHIFHLVHVSIFAIHVCA